MLKDRVDRKKPKNPLGRKVVKRKKERDGLFSKKTWSVKDLLDLGKLIFLSFTGAGFVIIVVYYFSIQYFPSGLEISDTIVFLYAILGFSVLYLFVVIYVYIISVPIHYVGYKLFNFVYLKKNKKYTPYFETPKIFYYMCVGINFITIFTIFSLLNNIYDKINFNYIIVILDFLVQGVMLNHFYRYKKPTKSKLFAIMIIIFPILFNTSAMFFIKNTTRLIGIRKENSLVYIDKKYENILHEQKIKYKIFLDNKYLYVGHRLILSTGVGPNTYINFNVAGNYTKMMEFPNKDLIVVDKVKKSIY